MTFDNSKTIISLRIKIFTATVLLLTYIIVAYFAELIKFPLLGRSDTFWTTLLILLYFAYAFYPMALNYQYVFYSDEGEQIVFRYFTAGIVGGRKNSMQVNKGNYAGYKVEKKYFGLVQSITIFQQLREGVAKYPPIFISNLTSKEKAKVLNSLYLHLPEELKNDKV